eukprot:s3823_g3.t1
MSNPIAICRPDRCNSPLGSGSTIASKAASQSTHLLTVSADSSRCNSKQSSNLLISQLAQIGDDRSRQSWGMLHAAHDDALPTAAGHQPTSSDGSGTSSFETAHRLGDTAASAFAFGPMAHDTGTGLNSPGCSAACCNNALQWRCHGATGWGNGCSSYLEAPDVNAMAAADHWPRRNH